MRRAAVAKHRALNNISDQLMPTQQAVYLFTNLQNGAAAIAPPHTPYPAPQMAKEPWFPRKTEIHMAAGTDAGR